MPPDTARSPRSKPLKKMLPIRFFGRCVAVRCRTTTPPARLDSSHRRRQFPA
ncbi:hypothetical protein PanWU01x14_281940, partial [Parasponia andersonii]